MSSWPALIGIYWRNFLCLADWVRSHTFFISHKWSKKFHLDNLSGKKSSPRFSRNSRPNQKSSFTPTEYFKTPKKKYVPQYHASCYRFWSLVPWYRERFQQDIRGGLRELKRSQFEFGHKFLIDNRIFLLKTYWQQQHGSCQWQTYGTRTERRYEYQSR
jgi:hypothetical protein